MYIGERPSTGEIKDRSLCTMLVFTNVKSLVKVTYEYSFTELKLLCSLSSSREHKFIGEAMISLNIPKG